MERFDFKKSYEYLFRLVIKILISFLMIFIYFLLIYKYFGFSNLPFKNIHFHSQKQGLYENKILIFTFWEPSGKLPGYLQLCINTWKKNIPNYHIIILDYSKLHKYLNSSIISKILYKKMTLPIQADAIRVAILEKYGGIWMDIDIIITNNNFLKNIFGYDLAFFGNPQEKIPSNAFIYAKKNSRILKEWLKHIIKRVSVYKSLSTKKSKDSAKLSYIYKWNYLGNGIINQLLKTKKKNFIIFDWFKMHALPERNIFHINDTMAGDKNIISKRFKAYNKLYFHPGDPQKIININPEIIFLHHSWTDKKYKYMSKKEFLKQNIMLSSLLKKILEKQ